MSQVPGALTARRLAPLLLAVLLAGAGPAVAAAEALPTPLMPLSEIRPGMTGVVRTVFEGNRQEEFTAEIVGVMEDFLGPGQDLILARLRGERVEFTGVAGGMSGSPVYIDGRLIGAISYRLGNFSREPIAGITPIHDMLRVDGLSSPRVASAGGGLSQFVPIETPLVIAGAPPSLASIFREDLLSAGLGEPMAGAAVSGPAGESVTGAAAPARLRPGDPVAARLMSGDLTVAATGTVTHVDGDRVYAFGHPAIVNGEANLPMARAEILLTLSSLQASTKLGRVLETVGSFHQSRLPAMTGELGPAPPMIPIRITVEAPSGSPRTFEYESVIHRELTPLLLGLATGSSILNTPGYADEMTVALSGRVKLTGHPDLQFSDVYAGFPSSGPAALMMGRDVQGVFAAVWQNRWEAPRAESVDLTMKVVEQARVTLIEGVYPSRTTVEPGESLEFRVLLRDYRGATSTRTLRALIPEGTPSGPAIAYVGGAALLGAVERTTLARRAGQTENLDQLIELINHLRPSDRLVLKVVRRQAGAIVQNEVMPALPPSILSVLASARVSGEVSPLPDATLAEEEIPLGQIVSGGAAIPITIK